MGGLVLVGGSGIGLGRRGYPAPTRRAAGGRNKEFNTGEHPSLPLPASRQTFKSGLRYYNKEGLRRNNAKHLGLISDKTCRLQAELGGKKEYQKIFRPHQKVIHCKLLIILQLK